jgi:acyl-CoA hydrolase
VDMCRDCNFALELMALVYDLKMVLVDFAAVVAFAVVVAAAVVAALGRMHRLTHKQSAQIGDVVEAKSVPDTGQQSWSLGMRQCKQQIVPVVV